MPTLGKTKVSPSLISTGSSFLGTSSYAVTASFAMNGGGGGSGGNTQTGSIANQTILYNVTTSQDNVISGLNLSSNKWGVTVVEEWNSGSGDIFYPSCSLLMHFSGSNNSTTFTDSSPNNFTVSANGNTKITSSISKFNGTSAYFDGTADNLLINYNSALHLSGDFTIEVWFYPITLNDGMILAFAGGLNIAWASYELFNNIDGINFAGSSANNGYDIGSEIGVTGRIGTVSVNTWNHIAVTRQGNVYRGYINGVQGYTQTLALTPYNPNARGLAIGSNYANTWGVTPANSINGYLDELRITKGVARYTSNFTTQSVQFPDSLPQYETKYVGLVGGLNDTGSDYGVQKLDDTSLKIRKMSVSGTPISGSPILSASVDRVYVNVLDYTNVMVTSSYALTASYVLGGIQTGSISNQTILYNVTTSQDNTITGLDLSGNKWDVSVIEEWNSGSIVGDEYYNNCSLLMHFSGSNGSTTFIDNSPTPKTVTPVGNAQISTAQSKFGGSSGYFDGTGDYLTLSSDVAFGTGTGNFTIEFWMYPVSVASGYVFDNRTGGAVQSVIGYFSAVGSFTFTGGIITTGVTKTSITANSWYHVACVRNSGTVYLFVDGVSAGTDTVAGSANSSNPFTIGSKYDGTNGFNGYIDDFRYTKGVARYTSSFTVPSSAFPDSSGSFQLQTKYIGLVGGLNDTSVDYGVEKLSDSSLKIRKMTASGQPLSGSGALSASVDRVYVNVLNYKEVQTTAQSASYAISSSYLINASAGESFHPFLLG